GAAGAGEEAERALLQRRLEAAFAEAADVDAEREVGFLSESPERVVLRFRLVTAVGKRRDEGAFVAVLDGPLELGGGIGHSGGGDDRVRDEASVRRRTEVE